MHAAQSIYSTQYYTLHALHRSRSGRRTRSACSASSNIEYSGPSVVQRSWSVKLEGQGRVRSTYITLFFVQNVVHISTFGHSTYIFQVRPLNDYNRIIDRYDRE